MYGIFICKHFIKSNILWTQQLEKTRDGEIMTQVSPTHEFIKKKQAFTPLKSESWSWGKSVGFFKPSILFGLSNSLQFIDLIYWNLSMFSNTFCL